MCSVTLPSVEAKGRWSERGRMGRRALVWLLGLRPTEWFPHVEVGRGQARGGMPALGVGLRGALGARHGFAVQERLGRRIRQTPFLARLNTGPPLSPGLELAHVAARFVKLRHFLK
jgi:hypothetical protein